MIQSIDFSNIMDADEIVANWEMFNMTQAETSAEVELDAMADLVEAKDFNCEYDEIVENLRDTAEFNPISETAFDLKVKAMRILQELR